MQIDWRTAWQDLCDTASHPVYFVLFTTGVGLATVLAFTICIWAFVFTLVGSIVLPAVPFYFHRSFLAKRGWVFEILNLEETWEINDATGAKVSLRKAMDVRFLRDEVTAINDPAWGDGELFSEYSCTPGSLATVAEGDARRYAVVTLNLPRRRGDIEHFEIVRVIAGGFTTRDEWIEVDSGTCSGPLKVSVVFPPGRFPQTCNWSRRRGKKEKDLGQVGLRMLENGKQECSVRVGRASPDEVYRFTWIW